MNKVFDCIVIDQSLKNTTGHHFEYTLSLVEALSRNGHKPKVFCHLAAESDLANNKGWFRHFNQTWNERSIIQTLTSFWNLGWVALGGGGVFNFFLPGTFGSDLLRILKRTSSEQVQVFVHTLNFVQFAEVIAISARSTSSRIRFHLVLRQDPNDGAQKLFKNLLFFMIRKCLKDRAQVILYSDTVPLAAELKSIFVVNVLVLPIPFRIPEGVRVISTNQFIVSYLGDARREKGFHLLPKIIESSIALGAKVLFEIQLNLQKAAQSDPLVVAASEQLKRLAASHQSRLRLHFGSLSDVAYYELLMTSSAVLIPYDPLAYRRRSSGIFAQAYRLGKICIVPSGTSFSAGEPSNLNVAYSSESEIPGLIQKLTFAPENSLALPSADRIAATTDELLADLYGALAI